MFNVEGKYVYYVEISLDYKAYNRASLKPTHSNVSKKKNTGHSFKLYRSNFVIADLNIQQLVIFSILTRQ